MFVKRRAGSDGGSSDVMGSSRGSTDGLSLMRRKCRVAWGVAVP